MLVLVRPLDSVKREAYTVSCCNRDSTSSRGAPGCMGGLCDKHRCGAWVRASRQEVSGAVMARLPVPAAACACTARGHGCRLAGGGRRGPAGRRGRARCIRPPTSPLVSRQQPARPPTKPLLASRRSSMDSSPLHTAGKRVWAQRRECRGCLLCLAAPPPLGAAVWWVHAQARCHQHSTPPPAAPPPRLLHAAGTALQAVPWLEQEGCLPPPAGHMPAARACIRSDRVGHEKSTPQFSTPGAGRKPTTVAPLHTQLMLTCRRPAYSKPWHRWCRCRLGSLPRPRN
jgi:hypothetical protein